VLGPPPRLPPAQGRAAALADPTHAERQPALRNLVVVAWPPPLGCLWRVPWSSRAPRGSQAALDGDLGMELSDLRLDLLAKRGVFDLAGPVFRILPRMLLHTRPRGCGVLGV